MRIDIPPFDAWSSACDRLRASLPALENSAQVQIYSGYQHAIYEATHGLARLFSHKKTVAVCSSVNGAGDLATEQIAVSFSMHGYLVKYISTKDLSDLRSHLDPFAQDLIFVLFNEDDAITGRVFDSTPIDEYLKDKRIFKIKISHSHFRCGPFINPNPFDVCVLSLRSNLAAIVAGERFRVNPFLAPLLPWPDHSAHSLALRLIDESEVKAQTKTILDFENSMSENFKPYFRQSDRRCYDRGVLVAQGVDGSALIDEVANSLKFKLPSAGEDARLESTSPCRWNHPRLTDWLLARGESEDTVRSLVIVDVAMINSSLKQVFIQSMEKLKKIQTGE